MAPQLHVLGLLTAIDVMVRPAYCQACGRWQQAEDALAAMAERDPESGALTVTTGTGSLMQNPMLRVALSANSCCRHDRSSGIAVARQDACPFPQREVSLFVVARFTNYSLVLLSQ